MPSSDPTPSPNHKHPKTMTDAADPSGDNEREGSDA